MKTFIQTTKSFSLHSFSSFLPKDLAAANKCLTEEDVQGAIDEMRGAVMIVYPMGLPPHDPIKMEFDNEEDLSGTQVNFNKTLSQVFKYL